MTQVDKTDLSIWEVRGQEKNFLYSKIMMWYVLLSLTFSLDATLLIKCKGRTGSRFAIGRQARSSMSKPTEVARGKGQPIRDYSEQGLEVGLFPPYP